MGACRRETGDVADGLIVDVLSLPLATTSMVRSMLDGSFPGEALSVDCRESSSVTGERTLVLPSNGVCGALCVPTCFDGVGENPDTVTLLVGEWLA